jgi:hypothetical protein
MKWGLWVYEVITSSLDPTVRSPKAVKDLSYPCLGKRNRRFFNKKRRFLSLFIYLLIFYSHCYFHFLAPGAKNTFLKDVLCSDPSEETERIRARG